VLRWSFLLYHGGQISHDELARVVRQFR